MGLISGVPKKDRSILGLHRAPAIFPTRDGGLCWGGVNCTMICSFLSAWLLVNFHQFLHVDLTRLSRLLLRVNN